MSRKISKFHQLSMRSKRKRVNIDEAKFSHYISSSESTEEDIVTISDSEITVDVCPVHNNDLGV